jgi:hypothetical protein
MVTYRLLAYSNVIQGWRDFADADNPLPFVQSFDTATGVAVIEFDGSGVATKLTGKMWQTKTILLMKIVATSTYSKTATRAVEDSFILTLSDSDPDNYVVPCANNKLATDGTTYANANGGSHVNDFIYTIGGAAIDVLPLVSSSYSNAECPVESKLFVYDEYSNLWVDQTPPIAFNFPWISGFLPATG